MELCLKIFRENNETVAVSRGQDEVTLVFADQYQEGDRIILETSQEEGYLYVQLDDAVGPAFTYLTAKGFEFTIPFGDRMVGFSPKAFSGSKHLLYVRKAMAEEVAAYKNLALNPYDDHGLKGVFPHASANVETRGEAQFAAKNATNGNWTTLSHGGWPYESWGINQDPDAAMRVDFGREVEVSRIRMYTRADFPHDNWWTQITVSFSDGSSIDWSLEKSGNAHVLEFEPKRISWVEINKLIKSDDPSPFPALSQIEVYGSDIAE